MTVRGSSLYVALLCAGTLLLAASSASAAYLHTTPSVSFGSDGTGASTLESPEALTFQQSTKRLYALSLSSPRAIHAFHFQAPGVFTPVGSPFLASVAAGAADPDIAADSSASPAAGNLYYSPDNTTTWGFNSSGSPLSGFPIDGGGELCGAAVDNQGDLWVGNYGSSAVLEYSSAGVLLRTVDTSAQGRPCDVEIDIATNDLYFSAYGGSTWRYSAASNYAASSAQMFPSPTTARLAVNSAKGRLYASNGTVRAFDISTATLLEEFGSGAGGIAVDESTDTVFIAHAPSGKIQEWRGAIVPEVTTGDPVGNSTVSGSVALASGGSVTSCYFEFGTSTAYGSQKACAPATPYEDDQAVTAALPGLVGETTYHYRLVAGNTNGVNYGLDKTIVPHNVEELKTEAATGLQRQSALLKGSFTGTGLETHYYFEWGKTIAYGTTSATPPGISKGVTTGPTPLSFEVTGLEAGTTYHYRVAAENSLGLSYGEDMTFTTLPAVQSLTTAAATEIAPKSATLNGSYLGDGDPTSYHFEYGKTSAYGSTTPSQNVGPAAGSTPLPADLDGLEVDTTYHYRVVATNSLGTTYGNDQTFATTPAVPGVVTKPASDVSQSALTLNGEFLGTGEGTHFYFEWGPTTAYGERTHTPPGADAGITFGTTPVEATITSFKGYYTYHYRLVATSVFGVTYGNDQTVSTLPGLPPQIGDTAVTAVGPSSALFGAVVTPNRSKTKFKFEYGPTSGYGAATPLRSVDSFDDLPHSVSAPVEGLMPGQLYHYRVVASNLSGSTSGPDRTFVTPGRPTIDAVGAGPVARTGARVSALVDPNSRATSVRFEYGSSRAYGRASSLSVPAETEPRSVAAELTGLAAGTVYHLRVVAENALGTTTTADRTFKTPGRRATKRCGKRKAGKGSKCAKKKRRRARPEQDSNLRPTP